MIILDKCFHTLTQLALNSFLSLNYLDKQHLAS